jgi:DNA-directed RNA polymerase subunit RPC12/RpoP
MRIELNCAECGDNQFGLQEDHADHAYVYCANCGHEIGTLAELKERVAEEVVRRSVAARRAA